MVFQDISNPYNLNEFSKKKSAANLLDRFFSFLIDYLVISPFVIFLMYSIYSNGFKFWKSNPMAPENDLFILIIALSYILCFSLIQSWFIAIWNATPGQYFLKVRIDFHESDNLIFFRALSRQISFWISFLFFGIPFLSMMTNRTRRTFYDRVGDTSVITKKNEFDFFSYDKEYRYWQSFMATLVLFLGFLTSALIWKYYSKLVQRSASFYVLKDKSFFCEELKNLNMNERLQVAVALNLSNQLSDNCLDKEADFVLWKQKISDYSLAYYAKSLTTADREKEKSYLKQSCAGQNTNEYSSLSFGCKIAYSFLNNQIEELYAELNEEEFLAVSLKYELSLILSKASDIDVNFAKIEKFNSLKLIKKYQVMEMLTRNVKGASGGRAPASFNFDADFSYNDEIINLIEGL